MSIIISIIIFILGAFTTAILDRFVWPGLLEKIEVKILGPKRAVLNIAEFVPLEVGSEIKLENFNLTFATVANQGWVVAIKKGHNNLRKEFGQVLFPTVLSNQLGIMDYSVMIKNTGRRRLSDIRIKIQSKDEIKYKNNANELVNIDFINCGGFSDNQFCDIRVNKLGKGFMAGLLVGTSPRSIWNVECDIGGSTQICEKNYQNFYVADVAKITAVSLDLGDRKIILNSLPEINNLQELFIYSYSVKENKWNLIKNNENQLVNKKIRRNY